MAVNRSNRLHYCVVLCLLILGTASAGIAHAKVAFVFPNGTQVCLLDPPEASRAILSDGPTPFFSVLTTLDMAVRMQEELNPQTPAANRERFKAFVRNSVQSWTPAEEQSLLDAVKVVHAACRKYAPALIPPKWSFIKTNGDEEGAAFYTRGPHIVLPEPRLSGGTPTRALANAIAHEAFHVYSRYHPQKRRELYRAIGFTYLGKVNLGAYLSSRRITNPDAPDCSYGISLRDANGRSFWAVPVVYSKHPRFERELGGLFAYVNWGYFEVRRKGKTWEVAAGPYGVPQPVDLSRTRGFFEQVGTNSQYLIHPEEILADNAALLVMTGGEGPAVRDPKTLAKVRKVLAPGSARASIGTPPSSKLAKKPSAPGRGTASQTVRAVLPRRVKVILRSGEVVPIRQGRASLGDPDVIAVVYEGAPPKAVQRLKEILQSGSNEYPSFTKSEKYPPWVYDKIRQMLPGRLGEIIAQMAKEETEHRAEERGAPYLDVSNQAETGYARMYLVSDEAMRLATAEGRYLGFIPVADTKFGTAVVNNPQSGEWTGFGPADFAAWLAHRLAAGDNRLRLPRIPPETYGDWESWVRDFITQQYARQLEDAGLLTKQGTG